LSAWKPSEVSRAGIGDQGVADTGVRMMSLFEETATSKGPVCTENLVRVDDLLESPNLAG